MKVPFGDLKTHYLTYKQDIDQAVERVLLSGQFVLGRELERFERDFEEYLGVPYVVGCASGTEAIYLALAAGGVGQDDEVIVVAHTAVPTISAISMTGATPVFVDIIGTTYVMDISEIESHITSKTKAIVPVHLYGNMVEMDPILTVAAKHNLVVVEDTAQATGATYKGVQAGTRGDYGAFSFYPSKNLGAFGDGGAVCTKSRESYDRLVMLRNYGQSKRYHHDIIGINSRLDEMQAAILVSQLPYLERWNERRRQIAQRYTQGLADVVATPVTTTDVHHVYHLYVIQTNNRDALQSFLLDKGIQSLIHYPIPAHMQKAYSSLGYKVGDLPTSEYISRRILSLPMFPALTDEQVDEVIAAVCEFHQGNWSCHDRLEENISQASKLVTQPR